MTPPLPIVEKIGDQYYIDGGVWPFRTLPLTMGKIVHRELEAEVAWAVTWGGTMGVNGYARVPLEGHPWPARYENYDQLPVDVHGGLTYGPESYRDYAELGLPPRPARTWVEIGGWIGFDTAHAWDVWTPEEITRIESQFPETRTPEQISMYRKISAINSEFNLHQPGDPMNIMWTIEQVEQEAIDLALQIALAMETPDAEA